MKRDLLRLSDLSREEIEWTIATAGRLKKERAEGAISGPLAGRSVGMIFYKSSTRTRISFEVGIVQLGGHAVILDGQNLQMSRGETVADSARVFSRYLDALVIRTYSHEELEELAAVAGIPVINALTDKFHPCQILSDLFTITEKRGSLEGLKVAYVGDGNNVANSWLLGAALMGMELAVATPAGYEPDTGVVAEAQEAAKATGARITVANDPEAAADGADVIYTDTWISMGQDAEADSRRAAFAGFGVDSKMVSAAARDVMVMHCLPAHRGEEIATDVIDGPNSVIWDQAENRLHVQKAILLLLLGAGK